MKTPPSLETYEHFLKKYCPLGIGLYGVTNLNK